MHTYNKAAKPARAKTPIPTGVSESAAEEDVDFVLLPVLVPVELPLLVPLLELVALTPPSTALPGKLTAAAAAPALKPAKERLALAATFSLMTITIPAWQCLACEQ